MVRPFPSAITHSARRRMTAVVAAGTLALAAVSSPIAFADDLKDKQKQVKKGIKVAHADLETSSKMLREATARLREAQAQLGAARVKLAQTRGQLAVAQDRDRKMQAKLDAAVKALERARAELLRGEQEVAEQRVAVGEMVAGVYEQGDPQLMGIASLLESEDPGDMTRSLATNESMVAQETTLLDELHAAEVLLTVKEARVEEQKGIVEVQRKEAAENLKLMQALEAQAEAEEASVRDLVGQRSVAMNAAMAAKAADRRVLNGLRAQESRIADLLRKRAIEAARRAARSGGSARHSNGFLSYPVDGYVSSPYGYRTHPIYGYYGLHNGTDFGADCGQPLFAGANGTVLERGYSGSYGNYLIIDHGYQAGVGLASRYNHATHYIVGPGEKVNRGEVVGYVGSTGWSTGCHLHFSVLENGNYVDPMGWL